jgi:hypothetical protein
VNFVKLKHFRFVNNNDIVTRVPPSWLGYRHSGSEVYFDHEGNIREIEGLRRSWDRVQGFLRSLRRFKIDHFADHSIHQYIACLVAAASEELASQQTASPQTAASPQSGRVRTGEQAPEQAGVKDASDPGLQPHLGGLPISSAAIRGERRAAGPPPSSPQNSNRSG